MGVKVTLMVKMKNKPEYHSFEKDFNKLCNEAAKMGYIYIRLINDKSTSSVGHLSRNIFISKKDGEQEAIFQFSHELGHCIRFRKRFKKVNGNKETILELYKNIKKSKLLFMIDELEAWVEGYIILSKNSIVRKGFWKYAIHCMKSHFNSERFKKK